MLLGEYAVLHGELALVAAVNKRMTVTLVPRDDSCIKIVSALGTYQTSLSELESVPPFRFVLAVLKKYQKHLKKGFDLSIESEFSDQMGLGSSAAVTVATQSALLTWLGKVCSPHQLVRHARSIIQSIQGLGSGADVAASVFGGMVAYRMQPLFIECFQSVPSITLMYSGSKTKTVDAVKRVNESFSMYPSLFKRLLQNVGDCAEAGALAARREKWETFAKMMHTQQGLMHALGVNTPLLNAMIQELNEQPNLAGAKISGSGLGDCIVALGSVKENYASRYADKGVRLLPVQMTTKGVFCEKI